MNDVPCTLVAVYVLGVQMHRRLKSVTWIANFIVLHVCYEIGHLEAAASIEK
jgi:hypothetical protein